MCGIVGYMTAEHHKGSGQRDKFLRQALIMDTLRGKDSTGLFAQPNNFGVGSTPAWLKQLGGGLEFTETQDFSEFLRSYYKYAVGHNRAATMGAIDTDSAHPFQEGAITMVHNGTLDSTWELAAPMSSLKDVSVDSHAICHNLAQASPEEAGREVIQRLDGAFALVWHDSRDDTLNIVRNEERPLHMAEVANEKTIYFMSEARMLDTIASRLRVSLRKIVYPEVGQWLKFNADDLFNPEVRKLTLPDRTYSFYGGRSMGGYHGRRSGALKESRESNSLGKASARTAPHPTMLEPGDNKVRVGGARREVPQRAQEMLLDCDLTVEDRVTFIAASYSAIGERQCGIVTGTSPDGQTHVVYNVSEAVFESANQRNWEVRPVAVRYVLDKPGKYKPVIVSKLVTTLTEKKGGVILESGKPLSEQLSEPYHGKAADDGEYEYREIRNVWYFRKKDSGNGVWWPVDAARDELDEEDNELHGPELVVGPDGLDIPLAEYDQLTERGCTSCQRDLDEHDADGIIWVNNQTDPLCEECVVEWTQAGWETD